MSSYRDYLINDFEISPEVLDAVDAAEAALSDRFTEADDITSVCQLKVLKALQDNHVNATHFDWSTGYGYDDPGRDAVERVYASVFHTEAALVRPNIVNGTHAIASMLFGILKPGEELIYATGSPYDTLQNVIGTTGDSSKFRGTLLDYGVIYNEVPLTEELDVDLEALRSAITDKTKVVAMQRSTGYDWRPAISLESMRKVTELAHSINPDIIVCADNCYGEFVDTYEPTDFGVDVIAGSLIKNPGGGIALSGGYICGREDLIERIAYRLTCPGIGAECGLTYGQNRHVLQGLFLAPKVVNAALKGASLCGAIYDNLGFEVMPPAGIKRSDIIQAIRFADPDKMVAFCQAVQAASPVDSYVTPMPWDMPGYEDQVVMAAGAFVQGSSIELSADAPLREPYIAYFQGGLTYEHSKFGVIKSLDKLYKAGLVTL
ncbi:MAG: methionine gamma-lyase family protein [Clostridiales bacterium]|nr:methionine gamma-lyase family protein [Candidatus Crickella merdequi]